MGGNFQSIKMSVQIYVYQVNVMNSYLKKSNGVFQNEGRGQRLYGLFPKKNINFVGERRPLLEGR